ncbi:MAG: TatD family hydrolase [Thermodesulfobacteriota bacterium]
MEKFLLIDTHAHLDDARFDSDRDAVIERASAAGVKEIITVGCWDREKGFSGIERILEEYGFIYGALGVHPHDAKDALDNDSDEPFDLIKDLALNKRFDGKSKIVGLGETGLDYHYENSPKEAQKKVFRRHINLARELNLPLIIHSREAEGETLAILGEEGAEDVGGVFHCFSGSPQMAAKALKMGFYLSFTGVVTFPKATSLVEAIKKIPVEKMLLETDCPYLAPVPERGKRNEPAFLVHTALKIAELKGLSPGDVARITTQNAGELFGIGGGGERDVRIAYPIRNSLYLNITNRCTNRCTFCTKFKSYTVKGHYLRLSEEPDFLQVIKAVGPEPEKYDEVVFCGYGEPLLRLDLVRKVGLFLKKRGCRIRVDTDGLANLAHGGNVLSGLKFVDTISVSLNAPDSETYQRLVKTPYGDKAYPAILYFLREAKKHIPKVVASVVAVPGLDIEACRRVAEDELGVAFRVREYDNVG